MKTTCLALAALLLSAVSVFAEETTAWRLFVADHADPVVTAIDLAGTGEPTRIPLTGPATLHRSASGKIVFAVQGAAGMVTAISSGIGIDDHGDHGDIEVAAPRLLGVEISGKKPSHFVEHDGGIALFFDGEGVARIVSERNVLQGNPELREVKTAAPHHGVAVAWGSYALLSEPNGEKPEELPVGIRVVDASGARVGDVHACPDLHGEASSGDLLAFACATGLLVVRNENLPEIRHLPYSENLPDGKSTTLLGGRGLQYFLGNYGPDRVVLIDPTAVKEEEAFRLISLPARRVHFAVDPVRPKFAHVFTEDGNLNRINVIEGSITGSLRLTEPYSMDGHWSDPRPRLAVAGDRIVVTDPLAGKLHVVDAVTYEKAGEIPMDGKPFNVVAVGGSGETHAGE